MALRVPVVGSDDPTRVTELAAMTLSTALGAIEVEDHQRHALEAARADERARKRAPSRIRGGKLGGGPIPAELNAELGSLREELRTHALAGDRLHGIDRLVSILVAAEREPVFVLEDTEAAIGGAEPVRVEAFFSGPVRAFMQEVDAALLIAVQDHVVSGCRSFIELRPAMVEVAIPKLDRPRAGSAITAIVEHRLRLHDLMCPASDLLTDDGLDAAAEFYDTSGCSLRHTLAVLQSASEVAADIAAERIGAAHIREAALDWNWS